MTPDWIGAKLLNLLIPTAERLSATVSASSKDRLFAPLFRCSEVKPAPRQLAPAEGALIALTKSAPPISKVKFCTLTRISLVEALRI